METTSFLDEKRSQGFTLIEVLIVMVILAVGFLGLSAMTVSTTEGLSFSKNMTMATTLARLKMEQIRNTSYTNISSVNFPTEEYGTIAEHPRFRRIVTINNNTPGPNMKTITVTVFWRGDGDTHSVTLSTIRGE